MFHWPYYDLRSDGRLYEKGRACFPNAPRFASVLEAESWLEEQDERGNVRRQENK